MFRCPHVLFRNPLSYVFDPLNTELTTICHLLALLGAHHILHVRWIRVKEPIFEVLVLPTVY